MRLKLLACEVLAREMCRAAAQSRNTIDLQFLPKGLHDIGQQAMSAGLQQAVDAVSDEQYDGILFGYALCNNGIVGVQARKLQIVVPRAHDCIALFLGSRQRYMEYFLSNPGVYYYTSGWVERGELSGELMSQAIGTRLGLNRTYEELIAKYGEEDAKYLFEQLSEWTRRYNQITYIDTQTDPDGRFAGESKRRAAERGWKFEQLEGSTRLLQQLVDGPWSDEDFLVVKPGEQIAPQYDDRIVRARPAEGK